MTPSDQHIYIAAYQILISGADHREQRSLAIVRGLTHAIMDPTGDKSRYYDLSSGRGSSIGSDEMQHE